MPATIEPQDLVIHILNVGCGDAILVGLPCLSEPERAYGMIDCNDGSKTRKYLDLLFQGRAKLPLAFMCATHPHMDHIQGLKSFIDDQNYCPKEFWDSGFRHATMTYRDILVSLQAKKVKMVRVSSGMEWYFDKLRITALSPSVTLRNRYATYGVDMNNASIVLRLENHAEDVLLMQSQQYDKNNPVTPDAEREASRSVIILAGDAEFEAWIQVAAEYPKLEATSVFQGPMVKKMFNMLKCGVVKVSHHGSMHSAPIDMYEKMGPKLAVISCEADVQTTTKGPYKLNRNYYPHPTTIHNLEECGVNIMTTDGAYEIQAQKPDGTLVFPGLDHPGSIMIVVPPGGEPRWAKLDDTKTGVPTAIPASI